MNQRLKEEIINFIGDESCKNGKWTWAECNEMIRYFYNLALQDVKKDIDKGRQYAKNMENCSNDDYYRGMVDAYDNMSIFIEKQEA